jgi:hypothetical protein
MKEVRQMRNRIAVTLMLTLSLMAGVGSVALAGQPGVDCADFSSTPGQSASAPGSAFNPDGKAGTVYAGQQPQNSRNPNSVSQYDVACRNVSR